MDATESNGSQPQPKTAVSVWALLALVAGAAALWLAIFGVPRPGALEPTNRAIGKRLPYFRLDPLTGDSQQVAPDELEGRVSLVNYWGTWCPPCRDEFPHMVKLHKELGDRQDFRMYLVSSDGGLDTNLAPLRAETTKFLAEHGTAIPTYADKNFAARKAMNTAFDWNMAYPTTLILDKKGIIRGVWIGYHNGVEREMHTLVKKLLDEPA